MLDNRRRNHLYLWGNKKYKEVTIIKKTKNEIELNNNDNLWPPLYLYINVINIKKWRNDTI